jgi:hypothetical protein
MFKLCKIGQAMLGGSLVTTITMRPQVAEGGKGLQLWRVAVNTMNEFYLCEVHPVA